MGLWDDFKTGNNGNNDNTDWANYMKARGYGGANNRVLPNGDVIDSKTGVYYGNVGGNIDRPRLVRENLWYEKKDPDPVSYGSGGYDYMSSLLDFWERARHAQIAAANAQRKLSDKLARDEHMKNGNNINANEIRASRYLDKILGRDSNGWGQGQRYALATNTNKYRANNDLNLTNNLLQNAAAEKSAISGINSNFANSMASGMGSMTPASYAKFADYLRGL